MEWGTHNYSFTEISLSLSISFCHSLPHKYHVSQEREILEEEERCIALLYSLYVFVVRHMMSLMEVLDMSALKPETFNGTEAFL